MLGTEGMLNTVPQAFGGPHVEIVRGKYHYVVCERGSEDERKTTTDEDELLYWLISVLSVSWRETLRSSISSRARIFVANCSLKRLS